jgi:hypothetical protein
MKKFRFAVLFVLLISLLLAAGSWAAPLADNGGNGGDNGPVFKQLAAPPEELAGGGLRLPEAAASGLRSDSALIPVNLSQTADGNWAWFGEVALDSVDNASLTVFSPGANWAVTVAQPGGRAVALDSATNQVTRQDSALGLAENQYPGVVYTFNRARVGTWKIMVTADAPRDRQEGAVDNGAVESGPDGYLLVSGQSRYGLYAHLNSYELLTGRQVGLVAYLYDGGSASDAAAPQPLAGAIKQAVFHLAAPDGSWQMVVMADDGLHGDGLAGDGVFGGLVTAAAAGQYTAQVVAEGQTPDNRPFIRTTQHVFPVIDASLSLVEGTVVATAADDVRLRLDVPAVAVGEAGAAQLFAEVWGDDGSGTAVPVAWIGGMVQAEYTADGQLALPLYLDGRWLARAGVRGGLSLQNIRLHDVETHIPMSQIASLAVNVESLPAAALEYSGEVTEEMLMGPRPEASGAPQGFAGVLMLIHGYCSGGVWPTSDFSQYAVFQDYNKNRTHDQFANLIRTYGNQFSSFGAVAHSQGGAASLHLYTYYWSGLDYSSGSRLIQSVGTPYRGTALAGNLAVLGQIFGAGCGTNWDLTYDGAGLWLSGIPSWARSRVYYSTTAFKDVWWRYDYCHLVTDLFLSDPDDGTTEKWAGQLSGANNMGHKSGWCHTNGMRDPAQYNDHSRNANMNTYGNR